MMATTFKQIKPMKPIRNNVLVKPYPSENFSEGGIILPDSVKKISNKVKIISTGNGTIGKPMKLKPGDDGFRVKDWGMEVMIDGELHFLMDQDAILALND